jgi:hypothetical protein
MEAYQFYLFMQFFAALLGWAGRGSLINRTCLVRHRRRVFASRFVSQTARQRASATLTTSELMWAYYLPDHRASSKSIIRDQLLNRGVVPTQIDNWLPPAADLTVPAYAKPLGETAFFRLAHLRGIASKGLRALLMSLLACLVLRMVLRTTLGVTASHLDVALHLTLVLLLVFSWAFAVLSWCFVVSLYCCPYVFQGCNRRFLILRPFGDRKIASPLKRLVMKSIGRFGHVFTLSDRSYRPSFMVYIAQYVPQFPVFLTTLLGMVLKNSVRIGSVVNERTYRSIQNFLLKAPALTTYSFLCSNQAFNLRCSDDWWQLCVLSLMHSSDVIFIDLSSVKSGTEWEIQQLVSRRLLSRSIFMAQNSADVRRGISAAHYLEGSVQIHRYDSGGRFLNEFAFVAELRTRLAGSHLNENYLRYHYAPPCLGGVSVRQNSAPEDPAPATDGPRASLSDVASGAHVDGIEEASIGVIEQTNAGTDHRGIVGTSAASEERDDGAARSKTAPPGEGTSRSVGIAGGLGG